MAQRTENRTIDDAVELLKTNGFEGLADAVTVLLNSAMVSERSEDLGAAPYERSTTRVGYANGFKDKSSPISWQKRMERGSPHARRRSRT